MDASSLLDEGSILLADHFVLLLFLLSFFSHRSKKHNNLNDQRDSDEAGGKLDDGSIGPTPRGNAGKGSRR